MLIPSQTSELLFLYDHCLPGKDAIQLFHKEVIKKLLNQLLQKLFGGGSGFDRVSHSWGGGGWALGSAPPSYNFFQIPPSKLMLPYGAPPT